MRTAVLDEIARATDDLSGLGTTSSRSSQQPKRMKDNVCLVVIYRDHVNLMFPRGVDMKDPQGLLEGAGKAMRHVKIRTAADTKRPGVRDLIEQAKERPDLGTPAKPLKKVATMVKAKKGQTTAPKQTWPRMF